MENYLAINKQAYDLTAKEYAKRRKIYTTSDAKIAQPFIDNLKLYFKQVKILELGPGSGLNLSFFQEEGFNTTALDISGKMIQIASEKSPNTKYIHSDFLSFEFNRLRYEGIFAKAFIHLFPKEDAIKVLNKMHSLLVPRGLAFIATTTHTKSSEGITTKIDYMPPVKRFRRKWNESELIERIQKEGFSIVSKDYHLENERGKRWINLVVQK